MRFALTWLTLLCVAAGLNARVLASDADRLTACPHASGLCCQEGDRDTTAPVPPHHDGDECPPDHHHHSGCCTQTMPFCLEDNTAWHPGATVGSLLVFRHESDIPPEGPFPGLEKPPLI